MKKNNIFWFTKLMTIGLLFMVINSCKKDDPKKDDPDPEPPAEGAVTDIDGNIYHTVTIGTQVWMTENLKTTKFNDGTAIPNVTDITLWTGLTTSAYCWYNNDAPANKATYGALYNWYAVNTGKLCPSDWHVPSDAEWTTLENYLIANGYNYDGTTTDNKYAKALASDINWATSTNPGTVGSTDYASKRNATGFTALPGGAINDYTSSFIHMGYSGSWWSRTEIGTSAIYLSLIYNTYIVSRYGSTKTCGFSVRCIRDN